MNMKYRTFNKLCRIHFGKMKKGELPLTLEQKHAMLLFVVRKRGPVHNSLVTPLLDTKWIECMGYLYHTGEFLHTGEHKIKLTTKPIHVNV